MYTEINNIHAMMMKAGFTEVYNTFDEDCEEFKVVYALVGGGVTAREEEIFFIWDYDKEMYVEKQEEEKEEEEDIDWAYEEWVDFKEREMWESGYGWD